MNKAEQRIPVSDLGLMAYLTVPAVLVFDGLIDDTRLVRAIELLTGVWPTLAGRYKSVGEGDKTKFSIELTNSPIPFETQTLERDRAFPDDYVLQPTLDPYLPPMGSNIRYPNTDNYLFAVRLTTLVPANKSVLGIQLCHLATDATVGRNLLKLFDALYTLGEAALDSSDPKVMMPTFFPVSGVEPLPASDHNLTDDEVFGFPSKPFRKSIQSYVADATTSSRVALRFTKSELQALRDQYQLDFAVKLSTQDALSAWWVSLLNNVGVNVETLVYLLEPTVPQMVHRPSLLPSQPSLPTFPPNLPSQPFLPTFPPNLPSLAAVVLSVTPIDISAVKTPGRVAQAIREHITKLRSSENDEALHWISRTSRHLYELAIQDRDMVFPGDEENQTTKFSIVNSNIRIDWFFSFGFKEHQVSYHIEPTLSRFLRVFRANFQEGDEKGDKVEVYFNVPNEQAEKAREIVECDRAKWAAAQPA
ncbi:hypothetical protein L202_07601 [Cryptococcus amylolentus CBS 6039]|uniref:Condensation domain-containing protein n=1 Tax=Cryptococcus amylolentus CBS 6039 TaxID=1295533 RepID=A0A1E3HCT5_9TREE|nr:hypothetical protein L202_07601 [Cryptococcus amylolentus CBS 6039]ODN74150.1 hypothetical protein L202_07601 [Cryptococcus amylolentus CBS 6039]